jgi:hypothetical protein
MSGARPVGGALLLASLVMAAGAAAQGMRAQFGVGGSLTLPTGDFRGDASGDGFNAGWGGMLLVDLKPQGNPIGFRVDGGYGENGGNDKLNADLTAVLGQPTTAKIKLLGGAVGATYNFKASAGGLAGYLVAGIGVYNVKLSVTSGGSTADSSETKFAWDVGGGTTYRAGRSALFFEVRYFQISKVFGGFRTTFLPITAGVRFGV